MSDLTWTVLEEHLDYLSDSRRLALFARAIQNTVQSGDRVLDLGCGTGVLGLMALHAGAGHVDAIDSSAALEIARQAFERAGFDRHSALHASKSFDAQLPERADVAVCDHIGFFGVDYGLLGMMDDACKRMLKPAARLIPRSLDLWMAPVRVGLECRSLQAWDQIDFPDLRWLKSLASNCKHPVKLKAGDLAASPALLTSIDLAREQAAALCLHAQWTMPEAAQLQGLAGWFDAELAQELRMNNSPLGGEATISRPQALFPFAEPLGVLAGERLVLDLVMRPDEGMMAWTVTIPERGVVLRQSSFDAELLPPGALAHGGADEPVLLNRRGQALQAVLVWCAQGLGRAGLKDRLRTEYADLFPSDESARRFVFASLSGNTSPVLADPE